MPSRKQNVDSSGRMFTTVAAYQTYLKQAIPLEIKFMLLQGSQPCWIKYLAPRNVELLLSF